MKKNGFTLIEVLITTATISILSLLSINIIFSGVSLKDRSRAAALNLDSLKTLNHTMQTAILSTKNVTGDSNKLFLSTNQDCWSFVYSSQAKKLLYDHQIQSNCVLNQNPTESFFSDKTQVKNLTFTTYRTSSGGYQVVISGNLETTYPFAASSEDFSYTFTSLIDQ